MRLFRNLISFSSATAATIALVSASSDDDFVNTGEDYADDMDLQQQQDQQDDVIDYNSPDSPLSDNYDSANTTFEILRSYPIHHCIDGECFERGTLQLGNTGARIDDSKIFDEMKDSYTLYEKLKKAPIGSFYTLKLEVDPDQGSEESSSKSNAKSSSKRGGKKAYTLETSIPLSQMKDTEDLHDSVEISLAGTKSKDENSKNPGQIIGINYRITQAWGLALFEHTTVRILRASQAPTVRIPPKPKTKKTKKSAQQQEAKQYINMNSDGTNTRAAKTGIVVGEKMPNSLPEGPGDRQNDDHDNEEDDQPKSLIDYVRKYGFIMVMALLVSHFVSPMLEGSGEAEMPPLKKGSESSTNKAQGGSGNNSSGSSGGSKKKN